jgi:hypothetical protein
MSKTNNIVWISHPKPINKLANLGISKCQPYYEEVDSEGNIPKKPSYTKQNLINACDKMSQNCMIYSERKKLKKTLIQKKKKKQQHSLLENRKTAYAEILHLLKKSKNDKFKILLVTLNANLYFLFKKKTNKYYFLPEDLYSFIKEVILITEKKKRQQKEKKRQQKFYRKALSKLHKFK